MNEIIYLYLLSPDEEDRIRVTAEKEKRNILGFVVQYEALIQGVWHPIVRYDTAHGFAHKDIMHPDGSTEKQPLHFPNYNIAFTYAAHDIKLMWEAYRKVYEMEMRP